jgi:glycosyltransferase involved in cell wall biosynthesis
MQPFTVFLPVYNEEDILVANTEKLLHYLDSLKTPYEVVIGSNGSVDSTPRLGQTLKGKYPQLRFFHIPEKGPGAALREAINRVSHDCLITLDMDLPVPLDFIPRAVELLSDHDIVVGSKKLGVERRSPYRRVGSSLFIFCSKTLLGLPFDDYSLGAKAYRKSVLKRYEGLIDRWTSYTERIICSAFHDGLPIIQIPVECRDDRKSRFNLFHEAFYRFGCLFRLWIFNGMGKRGK